MIQHVLLEVAEERLDACVEFWTVLGWPETAIPAGVTSQTRWLSRGDQQIHLVVREEPGVPRDGHIALLDAELDTTIQRMQAAGHEFEERQQYWGERRIFTRCPAGHRVELMSAPPAQADPDLQPPSPFPRG